MNLKKYYLVTFFSILASNSIAESLFDSIWINVRGGMGSGYAHAVSLQRGNWGVEHASILFDREGWLNEDHYYDKDSLEQFEPQTHGSAFSAFYRHIGNIGSLKASLGLGYFNGTWGFDCKKSEDLIFGDNYQCDQRDLNDVALVYGVEAVFGRFWGLGVSADYAVIQGEILLMGGLSMPIRVLSH